MGVVERAAENFGRLVCELWTRGYSWGIKEASEGHVDSPVSTGVW